MKYCSTRGKENGLSFKDVLFAGYAKDGGLYMPECVPRLSEAEVQEWSTCSYHDLMFNISRRFISEEEIPSRALKDVINSSLKQFRTPDIVEIKQLEGGINVVELFHGATLAFKDLALSVVGGMLDYFLSKSGQHITVLIGTSGDTGSAAIESVRGKESIDIIVLLPQGRCTEVQELQMTTVIEDNVHVFCVDGTSDDLDEPIKRCFADPELVQTHQLISINSINWCRIMAQLAHYFFTYFTLTKHVGEPLEIVVPTGAAGNITAGCLAKKMGLPITLVAAVNTNDIVARTLDKGDFSIKEDVYQTLAPAMDIQVPYNVERLVFLHCDGDTARVAQVMKSYEGDGKVTIPDDILCSLKNVVVGTLIVDDAKITEVMARVYKEHKYILCPHTATAVAYHFRESPPATPRGYIATASPAKFPEAVLKAGAKPVLEGVAHLKDLPTKCQWMRQGQDWYAMLTAMIQDISKRKKAQM